MAIKIIPAIISGIFVLNRLEACRPISKPMTPIAKLAIAMADVAKIMFALKNANEIPTANASMLVAIDKSRTFTRLKGAQEAVASPPLMAPQIMRAPRMQRIAQAIGVPTALNQRSAKLPKKYPRSVIPP